MLHGYWNDETTLSDPDSGLQNIIGNLTASGEAEKMIVVFPYIYTSKDMPYCTGMDAINNQNYDNFIYDLQADLMPYIEKNFSVRTGRENTAISGFSMGARESFYIGVKMCDKIGYVGSCHNEARFSGYQSAMLRAGLVPDIDHIFDTSPNEQNGILAAEYFTRLSDPPTGIYCANDIIAVGLLRFLQKRRVKLWEPSVISCDDIEQAQFTTPMLTTLALPKEEMAHFAMLLLLDRINGRHKQTSRLELQGTLMVRASCRPLHELTEPEYYI